MNIDALAKHEQFRRFFDSVGPFLDAYVHRVFTFTAIAREGTSSILQARLHLSQSPRIALKKPLRTKNLLSGEIELVGDPRETEQHFLSWLVQGFAVPNGLVKFIAETDGRISPWTQLNDALKNLPEPIAAKLTLQGVGSGVLLREISSQIEGELIESDSAFRNLKDWARNYELSLSDSDYSRIEVVADRVALVNKDKSSVKKNSVTLVVRVAPRTNIEALRLKAANSDANGAAIRKVTSGKDLNWRLLSDGSQEAKWKFKILQPAILHCMVIYKGWIQQELVVFDPKAVPNRARLMVEATDDGLNHLRRLLTTANPEAGSSRAFEAAVHLLLHLLGFLSGYAGALKHMEKEVDVLALSPAGDALMIECKTVPPSIEMLDKLISRAEAMRSSLSKSPSGFERDRIVPVMAVPNAWNEIALTARKHARMHGVVLLFREEIEKLVERTRFTPDANGTLREWLEMPLLRILTGEESI